MPFQVSAAEAIPSINGSPKPDTVIRRSANFHPSVWGNYFLRYASEPMEVDTKTEEHVEKLKKEVRTKLETANNPLQKLELIDSIQRLGLSYHFESEIDEILEQLKNPDHLQSSDGSYNNDDLHTVSLWFRLLRQGGYNIPSDIFDKFTDNQGKFNKEVVNDVRGMLSLYEAAHFRVHGEQILDEALAFTTTHLAAHATNSSSPFLAAQIKHALLQPIRTGLPRIEARHYISIYHLDRSHDEALLSFAKLDFNILQKRHQKELSSISRWWKELDFATKLPFARDRVVEGYFWILGVYFEPKYALARRILTEVIAITSVIDDIYDVYGTFEELQVFTDAIERWDRSCMNQLPEYMQYCYETLLDIYQKIEEIVSREGRSYSIYYAKEEMKKLARSYLIEAKWFDEKYTPELDEYMGVYLESCGYSLLTTTSFLGMGEVATKKAFDWVSNGPKIVKSASIICRLMDDVVDHKYVQERGDLASSVECYVKHHGVSEKEACDALLKKVVEAWKDINEECLEPRDAPMPLIMRVVNLARVMDVLYKDGDGYTHAKGSTKKLVSSLLVDPIPM
ncbi:(-)-germacrene D synthase-like [Ziziphus jujuba]|uniref:(-)-germacrene D synthase-like n=1 Tax=Ziziphus jujuba TaxID=326968 RepID=A0ABM3I2B5_ZIZJJ|nr:(-)-germacrene D synthase-like [Ziziphus jujuba]